jgi:hypothetical protein
MYICNVLAHNEVNNMHTPLLLVPESQLWDSISSIVTSESMPTFLLCYGILEYNSRMQST